MALFNSCLKAVRRGRTYVYCYQGRKWESSGRKWGTGQGGEKRGRASGVLSARLPLLAQEDPAKKGVSKRVWLFTDDDDPCGSADDQRVIVRAQVRPSPTDQSQSLNRNNASKRSVGNARDVTYVARSKVERSWVFRTRCGLGALCCAVLRLASHRSFDLTQRLT
eukprot:1189495-Prorocentrum_minimum.AAC.1